MSPRRGQEAGQWPWEVEDGEPLEPARGQPSRARSSRSPVALPVAQYGVPGEAELVAELISALEKDAQELGSLSSKFAQKFNKTLRGNPKTPFAPDKRNDGSFKKWMLQCGFLVGPLFGEMVKNRSLVYLPGDEHSVDAWHQGWQDNTSWADTAWDTSAAAWERQDARGGLARPSRGRRNGAGHRRGVCEYSEITRSSLTWLPDEQEQMEDPNERVTEAPFYIFLDAYALRRMLLSDNSQLDVVGSLHFDGLLAQCRLGRLVGRSCEERNRVIFVITDMVLKHLFEIVSQNGSQGELQRAEWLRTAPDSYLQHGHQWGFLEGLEDDNSVLETMHYAHASTISPAEEQRASQLGVLGLALRALDFAYVWDSHIEEPYRVIFVTDDTVVQRFSEELATRRLALDGRCIKVVGIETLQLRLAAQLGPGQRQASPLLDAKLLASAAHEPVAARGIGAVASLAFLGVHARGHYEADATQNGAKTWLDDGSHRYPLGLTPFPLQ